MEAGSKLFGTDGVRGVAGEFLTAELALALGRAAAAIAPAEAPQVLIVRDTRESGEMLEAALAAGVADAGGDALLGGVLPTPGASLLLRRYGFDLAAVVSASHNPYEDNGIKFFGPGGTKLDDAHEASIEQAVHAGTPAAPGGSLGRVRELHGAGGDYLRELELRFKDLDLSGLKVLLDCANGATFRVAPEIFRRLGAHVEAVAAEPDGRNINEGCGSTHVEALAATVRDGRPRHRLRVRRRRRPRAGGGPAGPGGRRRRADGPRGAAPARSGTPARRRRRRDGDDELRLPQPRWRAPGSRLRPPPSATGTCSRRCWSAAGRWAGSSPGTSSTPRFVPAGDGTATALLALEALAGRDLAERDAMEKLPQRLINVRVRDRDALDGAQAVWDAVERESSGLEGRGRVLVRPSGTEPLVRVMVEAPGDAECEEIAGRLAKVVEAELG